MASNFATVKLNSGLVEEARREAETLNRSLGGQIEHWARLGKAVENAEGFTIDRVRAALSGELSIEDLAQEEQDALFGQLGSVFAAPVPAVQHAYAELGERRGRAQARRRRGTAAKRGSGPAA